MGGKVIIDLGEENVREGEVFLVLREGREIVHPVTGEVLGKVEEEVAKIRVLEVRERFSYGEVLGGGKVRRGDRIRLFYESVCFVGSEEGFFEVASLLGKVRKGEDCPYVIREFEGGFGVEFGERAVAFYKKPEPVRSVADEKALHPNLRAELITTFPKVPLSADACGDHLFVLFEDSLIAYEVLKKEVVSAATLRLPAGYPVSVQCVSSGKEALVIVNVISGGEMSSLIARMVGGAFAVVRKDIPYYVAFLREGVLLGQKFDGTNLWGEVRKLRLEGDELVEGEPFEVPPGFRLDSAIAVGEVLLFIDRDGHLRVYRGDRLVLTERDFSGSYTVAELPGTYEDDSGYVFNPRPFTIHLKGKTYAGVIKNITSPINRFLGINKFSEGELYLLVGEELVKIKGVKFEEAVQSVVSLGDHLFVITARTGTLPFQNRGELLRAEVLPF